jgi:hypothetical protein
MKKLRPISAGDALKIAALVSVIVFLAAAFPSASFAITAREFYDLAKGMANINAFAATCQSAHETAFWTSPLWEKALNGAGIKADKNWIKSGRLAVKKRSAEHVGGRVVYRESYFRAYRSLEEFLDDYRVKIKRDYPLAAQRADNMWEYFSSLQKGRLGSWATTRKYFEHMADKALRLAPGLLGDEWREELVRDFDAARSRGSLSQHEIAIVKQKLAAVGIIVK